MEYRWVVVARCIEPRCQCSDHYEGGRVIVSADTRKEARRLKPRNKPGYTYTVERA